MLCVLYSAGYFDVHKKTVTTCLRGSCLCVDDLLCLWKIVAFKVSCFSVFSRMASFKVVSAYIKLVSSVYCLAVGCTYAVEKHY